MRVVGTALGMGALVVLVVTSAGRPAPPRLSPPGSARPVLSVDVVGDSLVTQAAGELRSALRTAGLDATVVHRPRQDLGSAFVQDELENVKARRPADALVLATAANDALRDRDRTLASGPLAAATAFNDLLDRSIAPFEDRCVVLVGAREETADIYHPEYARDVNELLRQARDRHANLVLVDWASLSRTVPAGEFAEDQLHFGPDPTTSTVGSGSAKAYAAAIVDGLKQCRNP